MTDTTWLTEAGLVPVSEGVWRDPETGLACDVDDYAPGEYWQIVIRTGDDSVIGGGRDSVVLNFSEITQRLRIDANFQGTSNPDEVDAHAAAVKLAARIARAYNERGR